MAIKNQKARKTGLAKEYSTIYFGDSERTVDGNKITSPIFVQILRSNLVLLKALKLVEIPKKEYKSAANLSLTFFKAADGLIWRNTKGEIDGKAYENSEVVTPPIFRKKLELTLIATQKNNKGLLVHKKISIGLPLSVNAQQVASFILPFKGALVKSKFGDSVTNFQYEIKDRAKNGSREAVAPWYIPIGLNTVAQGVLKSGAVGKSTKTVDRLVVTTIKNSSAEKLGYTKALEASDKDIDTGTKFGKTQTISSGNLTGFSAFKSPTIYSQIWDDTNYKATGGKTPIASPGTEISVKVRFTQRKNAIFGIGGNGGKIKGKSAYAYLHVPAGTPKGLIAEFLMQTPKRGRSFQIAIGGASYGTSVPLPVKNAAAK